MPSLAAAVPPPILSRETEEQGAQRAAGAWRRANLQIGAIIAIGASVVVLLWLIIVVVIETERKAAIDHARSEANNLSAAFLAEVTGRLDAITRAMDVVATQMQRDPGFDLYAWAQANPLLMATRMRAAAIISPDGWLIATTLLPHTEPVDMRDRDYFRAQVDGPAAGLFIGALGVGRLTEQPSLRLSRRVDTADGRLLGVLVFSVTADQITSLQQSVDLGPRGYLSLVGSDHVIRVRFGTGSADGELGVGARTRPSPPSAGSDALRFYIRQSILDHVDRLYSARKLVDYPLSVYVAFDVDWVLEPAVAHAMLTAVIGILATLMLATLIALLMIQIRRRTDREVKLWAEQASLAAEIQHGNTVQAQLRASEVRLRDIAAHASDWFWEQDAELRYVSIGTEPMIGKGDLSYIGKCRWEWTDASLEPELWANHRRDLAARKPFRDFRYSRVLPDGRQQHVCASGIPLFDDDGQFAGYRGTGRDITAEVAAEAELRAAKDRAEQAETILRDAVDSMSEGFVIYDHADRMVMCNKHFREAYGRSADIMVPGTSFEALVSGGLARGEFVDAVGREQAWLAERVQQFRACTGSVERRLSNGRWMLVTDRRMRNGGLAGLRVDITELKQTQAALRESEARLDRAQAIAGIGSWELDVATGHYSWSKELYRIRGVAPGQFSPNLDSIASFVHPDDFVAKVRWLTNLARGIEQSAHELRILRPDGEERMVRVEGRAVIDPDGVIRRLAGTMQDITERRLMERQLMQAQKMEAIGNLTGGMAHDFNNGLGIIIGNLDLLARAVKGNQSAEELCGEARGGALRCADLVRQLLAFARRQPLHPRQTDVNALVNETIQLLGRTLGEHIALTSKLDATLWPVLADPVQLEAALVNLATNARDAMPKGGQLDICTRNVRLDAPYAALSPEVTAGPYVLIEISDTGTGIAPEIVGRIFEPFFTTKPPGQGSGLGLSMVFGYVKQSGGHMTVYSEPDRGSTFRIYLPRAEAAGAQTAAVDDQSEVVGGHETVLVVEDNEHLRRATVRQLAALGYRVLEVADAAAALLVLAGDTAIDLLFTDVVIPGELDGIGLARQAVRRDPGLRVLLTSGFPAARAPGQRTCTTEFRLLGKPYHHDELARAVREVLERPGQRATDTNTARNDANAAMPPTAQLRDAAWQRAALRASEPHDTDLKDTEHYDPEPQGPERTTPSAAPMSVEAPS